MYFHFIRVVLGQRCFFHSLFRTRQFHLCVRFGRFFAIHIYVQDSFERFYNFYSVTSLSTYRRRSRKIFFDLVSTDSIQLLHFQYFAGYIRVDLGISNEPKRCVSAIWPFVHGSLIRSISLSHSLLPACANVYMSMNNTDRPTE